jgi:hypothetical protein
MWRSENNRAIGSLVGQAEDGPRAEIWRNASHARGSIHAVVAKSRRVYVCVFRHEMTDLGVVAVAK